jgi:hypothetical protein
MSSSFFVVLPSNTKNSLNAYEQEEETNKTNRFKVWLPRKLNFDGSSGTWLCGLHNIVYPNRFFLIYIVHNKIYIVGLL